MSHLVDEVSLYGDAQFDKQFDKLVDNSSDSHIKDDDFVMILLNWNFTWAIGNNLFKMINNKIRKLWTRNWEKYQRFEIYMHHTNHKMLYRNMEWITLTKSKNESSKNL